MSARSHSVFPLLLVGFDQFGFAQIVSGCQCAPNGTIEQMAESVVCVFIYKASASE